MHPWKTNERFLRSDKKIQRDGYSHDIKTTSSSFNFFFLMSTASIAGLSVTLDFFLFLCKFTTSLPAPTLIQVQGRPICLRLPALILQQGSCEARSVLWLQISDQGFCLISDHSLPLKWLLNLAMRRYPPPSCCLSVELRIRARAMHFRTNVLEILKKYKVFICFLQGDRRLAQLCKRLTLRMHAKRQNKTIKTQLSVLAHIISVLERES